MITTSSIKKLIVDTWSSPNELPGPAMIYLSALDEAERLYGAEGIKTMLLEIASNLRAHTPEQREVKRQLIELSRR